jgi:hypothetical protein
VPQLLAENTFFPTKDRVRARAARDLHNSIGHPNDHVLCKALDNSNLLGTHVTSLDVKNAAIIMGSCIACQQGKMRAPSAPTSISQPAASIGANIHIDIYPIPTSIGGNNFILMTVDELSDYVIAVPMPTKSTSELIKAMDKVVSVYQQHGHIVMHFTSDDENNLNATVPQLRLRKITQSATPAGLHEKKVERTIQTIKGRLAALKANLPFILPTCLEAEAVVSICNTSNMVPTINTNVMTPHQVFTGHKPTVPTYQFGTIGIFYHPRQDDHTMKAEIGLFLHHGYHVRYVKGYLPTRRRTYSFRKFVILRPQALPPSWNYAPNIRSMNSILKGITPPTAIPSTQDDTTHITNVIGTPPYISTHNVPHTPTSTPQYPTQQPLSYPQWPPLPKIPTRPASAPTVSQKQTPFSSPNQEGDLLTDPPSDQEGDIRESQHRLLPFSPVREPNSHDVIRSMAEAYPQSQLAKTMTEGIPQSSTQQHNKLIPFPSHTPIHRSESNAQPTVSKYGRRLNPT